MQMEIVFLGTSSMYPTRERNHSSVLVRYEGDYNLFDCGEGTQRQLRIAGISPYKVENIFLSHWHGDHSLGLGGVIQSLNAADRKHTLHVWGPAGTKKKVQKILDTYDFHKKMPVEAHDITCEKERIIYENEHFFVKALSVKHNIPCLIYKLEEKPKRKINVGFLKKFGLKQDKILGELQKGKDIVWEGKKISAKKATVLVPGRSVVYAVDFKIDSRVVDFCSNATILICESTFLSKDKEKLVERYHLSAKEAADLGKKARVGKLVLTHFSQRYTDIKPLVAEAREVFKNTRPAKDFLRILVK